MTLLNVLLVRLTFIEKNLRFSASLCIQGFSTPLLLLKPPLFLRLPSAFCCLKHFSINLHEKNLRFSAFPIDGQTVFLTVHILLLVLIESHPSLFL